MPPLLVPAVTPGHGGMSAYGTKRYFVAMQWLVGFRGKDGVNRPAQLVDS